MRLLKFIGPPGSIPLLILCCLAGLALLYVWPRSRRVARLWLGGVFALYTILAMPVVAHGIADRLPDYAVFELSTGQGLDALFVFDGDNRWGRVRRTAEVYRTHAPREVWIFGNEWLVEPLVAAGVPPERLRRDSFVSNTRDQVERSQRLLGSRSLRVWAVLTSRLQAPRVARLIAGFDPPGFVVPAPIDSEPPREGWGRFLPRYSALRLTRDAFYEHIALAWYARRGII